MYKTWNYILDDAELLANDVKDYSESLQNIQKKIDPSKPTDMFKIFKQINESIDRQDLQSFEQGLIVVASFVNRLPNLGGIARTCEVFGVKQLIVANLNDTKDKEFQRLSVTAEKWINMLQVF